MLCAYLFADGAAAEGQHGSLEGGARVHLGVGGMELACQLQCVDGQQAIGCCRRCVGGGCRHTNTQMQPSCMRCCPLLAVVGYHHFSGLPCLPHLQPPTSLPLHHPLQIVVGHHPVRSYGKYCGDGECKDMDWMRKVLKDNKVSRSPPAALPPQALALHSLSTADSPPPHALPNPTWRRWLCTRTATTTTCS